jgi:hypothetical protein
MSEIEHEFEFRLQSGRFLKAGVAVYEYIDSEGRTHVRVDYMGGSTTFSHRIGMLQTALRREERIADRLWDE